MGALQAGCTVALGIDSDPRVLRCFAQNVGAETRCVTLPTGDALAGVPAGVPMGPDVHAHFSPPCVHLSRAKASATAADVEEGLCQLRWALRTAHRFASWSIETVSTPTTRALFEVQGVAHATFDVADYGVPQTRQRLIAGPPALIARLREAPPSARVSVRSVLPDAPAAHLKNTTRRSDGRACVRSVEAPAFTVVGRRSLSWCHADGRTVRCMTARELARIQTLPEEAQLPAGSRAAILAVGNCVPSRFAACLFRAARGEPVAPRAPRQLSRLELLEARVASLEAQLFKNPFSYQERQPHTDATRPHPRGTQHAEQHSALPLPRGDCGGHGGPDAQLQ